MVNGWTLERRKRQAELIRQWKPWAKSTGPQQVNNAYAGTPPHSDIRSGAENIQSEPNKLLEADHGQRMDIGTQGQASRVNQAVETVGSVQRA